MFHGNSSLSIWEISLKTCGEGFYNTTLMWYGDIYPIRRIALDRKRPVHDYPPTACPDRSTTLLCGANGLRNVMNVSNFIKHAMEKLHFSSCP